MIQGLQDIQLTQGASLGSVQGQAIPLSFGNDPDAIAAAHSGVALCDRSHWGRLLVSDGDRLRFLHNQTTNTFLQRQPGEGCDTVFVTSTGRTIDLVTAYILPDAVLLLTAPGKAEPLMQWMDRFIFFADKVKLQDLSADTATFSLLGPASDALVQRIGAGAMVNQPYGHHQELNLAQVSVRVAVGSGLALPGYTLMCNRADAAPVWTALVNEGAVPLGEAAWEQLRIEQGRPLPGKELTEDYNPLEAGLWSTISLNKGCYIGQETIARLHTYRGVKQQLWGLRLSSPAAEGSILQSDDERVGHMTSCLSTPTGVIGLAYIRTKAIEAGLTTVKVDGAEATLVALPFISHEYL